jgi:magnesium transporter
VETEKILTQIQDNVEAVIKKNTPLGRSLWDALEQLHPADIADFLSEEIDRASAKKLFSTLNKHLQLEIFEELSDPMKVQILAILPESVKIEALNMLPSDELTDLFDHFSDDELKIYLNVLHKKAREQVLLLLQFDPQSAGGVMTTDVLTLRPDFTVNKSISLLQRIGPSEEIYQQMYVVDKNNLLIGYIHLADLVLQKPEARITEFMEKNDLVAHVQQDQETIANKMVHYGIMTVPVVDDNNSFLGIITDDTLVDVLREEASEDVQKMAALAPLKDSYFETSFIRILLARGSILFVLLVAGSVSSFILSKFEGIFLLLPILSQLTPMLTSTGGNASSQTSAIVIQGIAAGQIDSGNAFRFMRRELTMALVLGVVLGVTAFLRVYVMGGMVIPSLIAGSTVSVIVITSVILGGFIPLVLKRLNIDPAFSAGPFLATIMDILGVLIYCMIIRLFV